MIRFLAAVSALMLCSGALADEFTTEELHQAAEYATTDFESGNPSRDIYGFSVKHGDEGGAIVNVYWGAGARERVSYFCHFHNHGGHSELDCHEM